MSHIFTWTDLYQELADKVLSFKNDRTTFVKLVEKSYKDVNLEYKLYWNGHYFTDPEYFPYFHETMDIAVLRRGVIGVNKVGYVFA